MTMQDDVAHRAPEIHWPVGFDPAKADLFSHNELLIGAPCERVWQHIVDATKWPEWYPNSKDVRIVEGARLAQGAVFRWTTFGLPLESKINEFVPYTRIGWYGYAPGTTPSAEHSFYHTWFLAPEGDACRVVTDEVGMGKDAAHLRETDESPMHRGHDLWLATLKWMACRSCTAPCGCWLGSGTDSSNPLSSTGESNANLTSSIRCRRHLQQIPRPGQ
jgi:uncharacterized protein YndB with AHSA1/START domain